jgi:CRP/FNR family transcriptional regulator
MVEEFPVYQSFLAHLPLFRGIPDTALLSLEGLLMEREFVRGSTVFSEGEESKGFYIILKGRVKVYKLSADGREQTLHIVGAKELLGAVSTFSGEPYPAHADALEKTKALFFPKKAFLSLVKREPAVVMNMMANLALRLQHFTRMIEDLSLKEVPGRLAAYLLYLCKRTGCGNAVEIDISKGQLDSLLGTIPETLSRILRRMAEKDILEVRGRTVSLLKKDVLRNIVKGEKTGF